MGNFLQDFRYALRSFRSKPGFTAVAVATLALGIGGNTAMFSVVYNVLLKPLPYPESERLVYIRNLHPQLGAIAEAPLSAPEVVEYSGRRDLFEHVAGMLNRDLNLVNGGLPERIQTVVVSPSFFDLLGVKLALGRGFGREQNQPGNDKVVVLTYGLWVRAFASNPAIIDRTITLNGEKYTVAGVLPKDFRFHNRAEMYVPLAFTPEQLKPEERGSQYIITIARLAPGVTMEQVNGRLTARAKELMKEYPDSYSASGFNVSVMPVVESTVKEVRPTLLVLLAAVGFVLLIACVNVANLLLVRASGRQREIAVRTALGAGRGRLIQQLLTESVLLSLFGGACGVLLSMWMVDILRSIESAPFPRSRDISLDGAVLAFTLLVSVVVGLLFGIVPALHSSRSDLNETLKEGGRSGSAGRARQRWNRLLVAAEVALALVLLVSAGLMVRSLWQIQSVELGFNRDNVLTARVALPENGYNGTQAAAFYTSAVERLRTLPGVRNAGAVDILPLTNSESISTFDREELRTPRGQDSPRAAVRVASPGYFAAMQIPLRQGRLFSDADGAGSPKVALVDEVLARTYWPGGDAIGHRITQDDGKTLITIVGIVGPTRHRDVSKEPRGILYWPLAQRPAKGMALVVRTSNDPVALAQTLRREIRAIDPNQALYDIRTLDDRLAERLAPRRYTAVLLAVFAGVAILLASIGIYGVMAYSVSQRQHEIGIRLALGAARNEVVGMIVRQAMLLAGAGLGIGLIAALGATRALRSLLYGVGAADPSTYFAVSILLASVALLASYMPARRAARIDPSDALRYE